VPKKKRHEKSNQLYKDNGLWTSFRYTVIAQKFPGLECRGSTIN